MLFWSSFGPGHHECLLQISLSWLVLPGGGALTFESVFERQVVGRSGCTRSALLPLHERLIVAADGEECSVALAEQDTNDVLGVATVRSGLSLDARVVEDVHETEVVAGGEEHMVVRAADGVHVSAVCAGGVDARGLPEELAGDGCPFSVFQVGSAGWVLLAGGNLEEEQLVGAAVRADELGVGAPVEGHDV